MLTTFSNGHTIDTWYDKQSKLWITQLLDENAHQIGDAEFSPNKQSALYIHKQLVKSYDSK